MHRDREGVGFRVAGVRGGRLVFVGLLLVGLGFVMASADPGAGPRTVPGASFLGPFYLPPFLVGLVIWIVAGLAYSGRRWAALLGAAVALIFLVGSAVFGAEAIAYRLGHPGEPVGFVADVLQLGGELLMVVGGVTSATRRG